MNVLENFIMIAIQYQQAPRSLIKCSFYPYRIRELIMSKREGL